MSEAHQEITDADIAYILENPWEKSKGEWRLANVSERQETLQFIKERLRSTQTGGVFQNMENAGQ